MEILLGISVFINIILLVMINIMKKENARNKKQLKWWSMSSH